MNNQEHRIELIKSLYPIVCFCIGGSVIMLAIALPRNLSSDRWIGIIGFGSGSLAAGAGIAQGSPNRQRRTLETNDGEVKETEHNN